MAEPRDDGAGLPGIPMADARLSADRRVRPWTRRLMIYLRALACLQLLKGLAYWGALIGTGGSPDPLAGVPTGWLVACVFFAVADPVAAVGLWLGASWGVVIWLLSALGQLALSAAEPATSPARWLATGAALALMTGYAFLSMRARSEAA